MLFFDPTILSRLSYLTSIAAAGYVFGNHSPFPILATFQETLHCAFMLLFVFSCSEKPAPHLLRAQVCFHSSPGSHVFLYSLHWIDHIWVFFQNREMEMNHTYLWDAGLCSILNLWWNPRLTTVDNFAASSQLPNGSQQHNILWLLFKHSFFFDKKWKNIFSWDTRPVPLGAPFTRVEAAISSGWKKASLSLSATNF